MKRKEYEKPTMQVVELKQTGILMTSGPLNAEDATIDDYEDGVFSW